METNSSSIYDKTEMFVDRSTIQEEQEESEEAEMETKESEAEIEEEERENEAEMELETENLAQQDVIPKIPVYDHESWIVESSLIEYYEELTKYYHTNGAEGADITKNHLLK